ncbi:MAG TPA: DUF3943 domain-containing protein [Polyangia bacterium]|nr:DUF3943 domain-containing protein [Polyangia bacterium]
MSLVAIILAILAGEPFKPPPTTITPLAIAPELEPEAAPEPVEAPPLDLPEAPPSEHRPRHPYLRTGFELLTVLGLGTAWYWRAPSHTDFDLHFTWNDWKAKLFSTRDIVLDDNLFDTNALAHPVAGAIYYQVARGNGLSPAASLLTSVIGSTIWEYLVEFREKPSTNDMIFTPIGGAVLGEATYRLGRLFASGSPNLANCVGAMIFAPIAAMNDTLVCRSAARPPFDAYGFSRWTPHRLELQLGETYASFDGGPTTAFFALTLGTNVVSHRAYGRPGQATTAVHPGDWTGFDLGGLIDGSGLQGASIHADTVWWGRYLRRFDETGPLLGTPDGRGLMLGLRSTFDYDDRSLPGGLLDREVNAGIVGPTVELVHRSGRLALRLAADVTYGFAMVTSLAYPEVAASYATDGIKSELRQQGYYYAQSVVGRASVRANLAGWELLLAGRFGAFWSINADDRFQAKITDNFSLSDQRSDLHAAATVPLFTGPLALQIAADQIDRRSVVPGLITLSRELRAGASIGLLF